MTNQITKQKLFMPKSKFDFLDSPQPRRRPVLNSNDEVDTGTCRVPKALHPGESKTDEPQLTNAELVQLQIRVIALEHLVIVLLSEASDRQRAMALELATTISPKPGFTPHRLTIHAAAQMIHLSGRASLFGIGSPK